MIKTAKKIIPKRKKNHLSAMALSRLRKLSVRAFLLIILLVIPLYFYGTYFWAQTMPDFDALVSEELPKTMGVPTPTPSQRWLSTSGKNIVDDHGQVMILRGVNVPGVNWGYETNRWNPKGVSFAIKGFGAQVIRTRLFQDPYFADREGTIGSLEEQVIKPARKNGAYVILSPWIHDNDPLPDTATIQMWKEVAARYKDDPTILYDVLSEPHDTDRATLRQAYVRLIEAVRESNPRALIFVTGLAWGREINSYLDDPLPYPNLVYRTNPYNHAGEFESLFGRIATKYPVFLGEFGADAYPPMSKKDVQALISYADELGIGWTAWNFHSNGCPCLLSNYETYAPSAYGTIVFASLRNQVTSQGKKLSLLPPKALADVQNENYLVVYDDAFQNAFVDRSWGTDIDLLSGDRAYQDNTSIKARFIEGGGSIVFHTFIPVAAVRYTNLRFYLHWGGQNPFPMVVKIDDATGKTIATVDINTYLLPAGRDWHEVNIPLKDVGATAGDIENIVVQNQSVPKDLPIYIDEVSLINNSKQLTFNK